MCFLGVTNGFNMFPCFFPPARWGSLDCIYQRCLLHPCSSSSSSASSSSHLPAPDLSGHCRTSLRAPELCRTSNASAAQWALPLKRAPDHSGHCHISVAPAQPQLRAARPDLNRDSRTSTASSGGPPQRSSGSQWALPGLNRELQISMGTPDLNRELRSHCRTSTASSMQISVGTAGPQPRALKSGARGWGPAAHTSERTSE